MSIQRVYILLALCVLFWSGNFILGRFVNENIKPLELAFFRWLFVFIFIIPIIYKLDIKRLFTIYKKNFFLLTTLAILGITCFNTFLYIALQTTTATNALLINSTIPILILILSFIILKTTISKYQTIGIILSTLGVIFLVLKGDVLNFSNIKLTKGDFWIIASSFTWAIYSTIIKLKPKELNHIELFVIIVFLGLIFLTPFYLIQGYTINKEIELLKNNWYFFLYVSIFPSLLSFYFWHIGIDEIGAEKTGQFTHLMPIFGSTLAFVFLGERLQFFHLVGAVFIALGIYLSLFIKRV